MNLELTRVTMSGNCMSVRRKFSERRRVVPQPTLSEASPLVKDLNVQRP